MRLALFSVVIVLMFNSIYGLFFWKPLLSRRAFNKRSASPNPRGHQPVRQGRTYNDIARVVNPGSPYINPRGSPFPAQPFWTYG